jgi:hypothetical protein
MGGRIDVEPASAGNGAVFAFTLALPTHSVTPSPSPTLGPSTTATTTAAAAGIAVPSGGLRHGGGVEALFARAEPISWGDVEQVAGSRLRNQLH